jgi:putative colanic acid biosynthesis UDP-glucose lipid carrier transferase
MMPLDCAGFAFDGADQALEAGSQRLRHAKLKRVLDVFGAAFGLVLLAPFLVLVGVIIRLDSRGPAIFRQWRSGLDGVPFRIYKFRTMRCLEDGAEVVQARRADERKTRVGTFLRRTSIDELPNLLNVLKGEMSLVGPRPHALAHDDYYGTVIAGYSLRYMTRPGLTGLAQVEGLRGDTSDVASMAARVSRDIEYIRRWSFMLDVKLLFCTVVAGPSHPAAH